MQKEVSQIADQELPIDMLNSGLSWNLNHLKVSSISFMSHVKKTNS